MPEEGQTRIITWCLPYRFEKYVNGAWIDMYPCEKSTNSNASFKLPQSSSVTIKGLESIKNIYKQENKI